MSKNYDTEKYKKTFIAAGVTCLPVAAMFITYAVFLIFYFTGLFSSNMNDDTAFAIVALIFIFLKPALMFVYVFFENYRARYYARIPFRLFRSRVHTPFPIGNQHSIQPKSIEKTTALNFYGLRQFQCITITFMLVKIFYM